MVSIAWCSAGVELTRDEIEREKEVSEHEADDRIADGRMVVSLCRASTPSARCFDCAGSHLQEKRRPGRKMMLIPLHLRPPNFLEFARAGRAFYLDVSSPRTAARPGRGQLLRTICIPR